VVQHVAWAAPYRRRPVPQVQATDGYIVNKTTSNALLAGGKVVKVYHHKGSPGGHNNDCVILTMETGARIRFDAYSPGLLCTEVVAKSRKEPT
jgi:hypothetical protein